MKLRIYNASAFNGGAVSNASQGRCSFCGKGAKYMSEPKRGARKAYCTNHAEKHLKTGATGNHGDALACIFSSLRNTI